MAIDLKVYSYLEQPSALFREYANSTDKETVHKYGLVYDKLLYKKELRTIVEVGVLWGGSVLSWARAYPNTNVYGIDVDITKATSDLNQYFSKNVTLLKGDAYSGKIANLFSSIDLFVDDGPHTVESQVAAINLYMPKMSSTGLFIIEDVQSAEDCQVFMDALPDKLIPCATVYDLSEKTGRYDDRLFVVDMSNLIEE
jgi:cephalosporin hydroxylase